MKKPSKTIPKNKALYKAVSALPVKTNYLPVDYVKHLPMVIGAIFVILLFVFPVTRNAILAASKNSWNSFSDKTAQLKSELGFSLRTGMTAYTEKIKENIKVLPIDYEVEQPMYLGRVEVKNTSKKELNSLPERIHYMQASISGSLRYFK
jgi:hypothetical protein